MAIIITSQLHGYEHGHHLLNSSAKISKADQSIIDRLSDVAGPLRPGENFEPYLTGYPLPSGDFYVLARTWQDYSVPRAGCVRTLSLIVPTESWSSSLMLDGYLDILSTSEMPTTAITSTLTRSRRTLLPPVSGFAASELLEAMFLEETKPVALFDAPQPELIAVRLLTALWPSMRRRFAVCTFALSPRKIEGRSFDLVFAPKNARSRFSNWEGRRIDANGESNTRHRWTQSITDRVFFEPIPRLLNDEESRLVGGEGSGNSSALRIALLWEELKGNLESSPSAALGLLDIASSRINADPEIIASLQPAIADAAHRAVATLPPSEAWELIGALAKKMHGPAFAVALPAIGHAAGELATRSPDGAIALIEQPDPKGTISAILPQIAFGLQSSFTGETELALIRANPIAVTRLISTGRKFAETAANSSVVIEHIAEILPQLPLENFNALKENLLPFLAHDFQQGAFATLVGALETDELLIEVRHLAEINSFAAERFIPFLAKRALELGASASLRDALVCLESSQGRDRLLSATLRPTTEDTFWLLSQKSISAQLREKLLLIMLRQSSRNELEAIFNYENLPDLILKNIPDDATDILFRAAREIRLPLPTHLNIVSRLLPSTAEHERIDFVWPAVDRCLREHFSGDEASTITALLNLLGEQLNASRLAQRGLSRDLETSLINRNITAFEATAENARNRILHSIEDFARTLTERYTLDINQEAGAASARLLWDAIKVDRRAHLSASGRLLPVLLRSGHAPVSQMIAATFPSVYCELAKESDVPDLLRFIPFFDWDRCKSARQELVDAFLRSRAWSASDFALTAYYTADLHRFLRRVAKSYGGEVYIKRILDDISKLPENVRSEVFQSILLLGDLPEK